PSLADASGRLNRYAWSIWKQYGVLDWLRQIDSSGHVPAAVEATVATCSQQAPAGSVVLSQSWEEAPERLIARKTLLGLLNNALRTFAPPTVGMGRFEVFDRYARSFWTAAVSTSTDGGFQVLPSLAGPSTESELWCEPTLRRDFVNRTTPTRTDLHIVLR